MTKKPKKLNRKQYDILDEIDRQVEELREWKDAYETKQSDFLDAIHNAEKLGLKMPKRNMTKKVGKHRVKISYDEGTERLIDEAESLIEDFNNDDIDAAEMFR